MLKQEIVRRFERDTNGQAFVTVAQLARLMGRRDQGKLKKAYLSGLEAIDGKYYFIPDVAQVLKERCTKEDI